MLNTYLDSNIYITGLRYPESSSALILKNAIKGNVFVVQSDYLINETLNWFRIKMGKDWVGKARLFMISIPNREVYHNYEWGIFVPKWKDLVDDKDDIPHICAYFAGNCECFVTTNRKLTQMKIKDHVNFKSPDMFLEIMQTEYEHSEEETS